MNKYKFIAISAVWTAASIFGFADESKEHSVDLKHGEVSLEFDNKKILKGTYAAMITLTSDFNKTQKTDDTHIDDYVWRLRHIIDQEGGKHDVVTGAKNGKLFEYFPLNEWLKNNPNGMGRQIMALVYILDSLQEGTMPSIDDKTIEILKGLYANHTGRIKEYAGSILSSLSESKFKDEIVKVLQRPEKANPVLLEGKILSSKEDPLKRLDLQGRADYLALDGVQILKGSVGGFIKAISKYNTMDPQKQLEAIAEMNEFIPDLEHLGFFDFFCFEEEWLFPNLDFPGKKKGYELYQQYVAEKSA